MNRRGLPSRSAAVIVQPLNVAGVARIALILDSVGAPLGLWQPAGTDRKG